MIASGQHTSNGNGRHRRAGSDLPPARQQPALGLQVDVGGLAGLIEEVVQRTLAAATATAAKLGDRLAYSEAEAAALLGLAQHQLRDERRRGRITASCGPGRRVLYSRNDLESYLAANRWTPTGRAATD